jgi:hypothetical protein
LAHAVVVWLHGEAHQNLGVDTFDWLGDLFIYVVILAAPIVSLILLWTRFQASGIWLLLGSMAGSLIFGSYNHFVAITPDHVSHLPAGEAQTPFRITAFLLVVVEIVGCWIAWRALYHKRRALAKA